MLKLEISDDEGKKTVVPLVRDEITIGRKEGNTIRLTERNVSRRHARIVKRNNDYMLEDMASYNGIVINNARLVEARPVHTGDEIRIGDYMLRIVDEPGVQPAPTPPPASTPSEPIVPLLSAPPVPMGAASASDARASKAPEPTTHPVPEHIRGLRIVFLAPAGVPPPVMLDRLPMVMGRSEAADVALPFSSISREHARLYLEDDKLMIEDLGSSNGVQVNGDKHKKSIIGPGDMVQIGVVEFRVARRGDSTVVIQKTAAEEKHRSRKTPVGLIGAIIGGGLALGLVVVLAVNSMGKGTAESPTPTVTTQPVVPAPPVAVQAPAVEPTPVAVPVAVPTVANTAPPEVVAAPPQPVVVPAPVEPVPAVPEVAPAPTPPTVQRQQLETPAQRRAREREERQRADREAQRAAREAQRAQTPVRPTPTQPVVRPVTQPPAAHVEPTVAPSASSGPPWERAMACRNSGGSEPERNTCIINALRGASGMRELGLLATTLRTAGRSAEAQRAMRDYVTRFPQGPLVSSFRQVLDGN
jgi:ABC transport system ATP-binding/permease protein